ncbi:aldo/keto reductase [Niabella hibiscisoli]|uniref:aldo/keto reductase n=1 Tax=Niabella hibiscisoli TaxID=1825928 RepID=UPI0021D4837F|nr:aldo/keto reductase [Niabella hibiscisoli]
MNYRNFKAHNISEIGLGTWQLGSADWGMVNEEEAFTILKTYTDAGGNFIDTADVYGMGISESLIGRFLKTIDTPVLVATKLGRRHDSLNGWPQNFSYDFMRQHIESSLEKLGVGSLF